MTEGKLADAKAIRLELSGPCDAQFSQVLTAMSKKMAAYVGYGAREATEVADTLTRATEGVFAGDGTSTYATLDVTFATSDHEMEIRVRYISAESNTAGPGVERLLSQQAGGDTPLALMRRAMRTVEFGRDDGVEICTLTKLLPVAD